MMRREFESFQNMMKGAMMDKEVKSDWAEDYISFKSQTIFQASIHHMINHSCNPHAIAISQNRERTLIAIRPIKKNDQVRLQSFNFSLATYYYFSFGVLLFIQQIFVMYSGFYSMVPKQERVGNFDFICHCEACSNDWPTMHDLMLYSVNVLPEK